MVLSENYNYLNCLTKLNELLSWKLNLIFVYSLTVLLFGLDRTYGGSHDKKSKLYGISVVDMSGKAVSLNSYKGKVLLIVNVATYCGFTESHYKDLVELQEKLGSKKFTVLAFPCNQFGEQEPDSNEEILEFVKQVYKVNFPLFQKIDVKGDTAHPLFKYLTEQSGKEPSWNFWKYLIDHEGNVIDAWGPMTSVASLTKDIQNVVDITNKSSRSVSSDEF